MIREVLEEAASYEEAVEQLTTRDVTSDSLLLVSGVESGQMTVIERSPTRSAVRNPSNGFVHVTNDYKSLQTSGATSVVAALADTSCGRFERAQELIEQNRPTSPPDCFEILKDPKVKMLITVQQMVFCPRTGAIDVRPGQTP